MWFSKHVRRLFSQRLVMATMALYYQGRVSLVGILLREIRPQSLKRAQAFVSMELLATCHTHDPCASTVRCCGAAGRTGSCVPSLSVFFSSLLLGRCGQPPSLHTWHAEVFGPWRLGLGSISGARPGVPHVLRAASPHTAQENHAAFSRAFESAN